MTIEQSIHWIKTEGSRLAEPIPMHCTAMPPMRFMCSWSDEGASAAELAEFPYRIPSDLRDFWMLMRTALLFEDVEYGQWGLEIVDPSRALQLTEQYRTSRDRDADDGDLVVGRFLGDSDLLLIRCDPEADDYGAVLIASPLDQRRDWDRAGKSFATFLETYLRNAGKKFWS